VFHEYKNQESQTWKKKSKKTSFVQLSLSKKENGGVGGVKEEDEGGAKKNS